MHTGDDLLFNLRVERCLEFALSATQSRALISYCSIMLLIHRSLIGKTSERIRHHLHFIDHLERTGDLLRVKRLIVLQRLLLFLFLLASGRILHRAYHPVVLIIVRLLLLFFVAVYCSFSVGIKRDYVKVLYAELA